LKAVLVDSNVILDLLSDDPVWADWSEAVLSEFGFTHELCINPIVYTEISIGFDRIEDLEKALDLAAFKLLEVPKEALFLAGKVFLAYPRNRGGKTAPLPDFYIGAHAAVAGLPVITRDPTRIGSYFPTVELISP
jgi:predicted nucleic acid-binding protein